jgi:hypothetical protein
VRDRGDHIVGFTTPPNEDRNGGHTRAGDEP